MELQPTPVLWQYLRARVWPQSITLQFKTQMCIALTLLLSLHLPSLLSNLISYPSYFGVGLQRLQ